jgi:7-cyano-7-deazaguanine reductase
MGYELSWLGSRGKPEVGGLRLRVPANSPCMVESKSVKLYLGSLAQSRFASRAELLATLNSDLSLAFRSPVLIELLALDQLPATRELPGISLDGLDVKLSRYVRAPGLLEVEAGSHQTLSETFHTHLFRSLCPVTGQPDFASIVIQYVGPPIVQTALLAYLVSYRTHQAFHEATSEQIFLDLSERCSPSYLSVAGRFLRRGGIDINPFRSSREESMPLLRLSRQ